MATDSITMPPDLLEKAREAARLRDTTVDEFVQSLVRSYFVTNDEWEALFERGRVHAKAMGITSEEQVDEFIHEWRREQADRAG